jgi:hypothetical protein
VQRSISGQEWPARCSRPVEGYRCRNSAFSALGCTGWTGATTSSAGRRTDLPDAQGPDRAGLLGRALWATRHQRRTLRGAVAQGGGERVGVGGLCARLAPGTRRYAYWRSSAGCSSTPCGSSSTSSSRSWTRKRKRYWKRPVWQERSSPRRWTWCRPCTIKEELRSGRIELGGGDPLARSARQALHLECR